MAACPQDQGNGLGQKGGKGNLVGTEPKVCSHPPGTIVTITRQWEEANCGLRAGLEVGSGLGRRDQVLLSP